MGSECHYLLTYYDPNGEQALDFVVSVDWDEIDSDWESMVRHCKMPDSVAFWNAQLGPYEAPGPLLSVRHVFAVVRP